MRAHATTRAAGRFTDFGSTDVENTLRGQAGNDHLSAKARASNADGSSTTVSNALDGGSGDDHLTAEVIAESSGQTESAEILTASNFDLDLTTIADDRIANVERLDLTSDLANGVTLGSTDVLAMTDSANALFLEGDSAAETGGAADSATLVGGWSPGPIVDGFNSFTLAGATVNVEAEMTCPCLATSRRRPARASLRRRSP